MDVLTFKRLHVLTQQIKLGILLWLRS